MNKPLLSLSKGVLTLFSATALLTPGAAQAQTGPQKGYAVTLAGDTLRGNIVLGRAQRNSQQGEFRAAGQTATRQYQPTELRAYGNELVSYESHVVPRFADSVATTTMPVFLEVMTRGPLTLYSLNTDSKVRYFLSGFRAGKLVELLQPSKMVSVGERQFVATQPLYQDTLARAFQACPAQAKKVKQLSLEGGQLEKAVRDYNTCVAPQTVSKKRAGMRRSTFQLGFVVGSAFSDELILGNNNGGTPLDRTYNGESFLLAGPELTFTPGFKGAPFTVHSGLLYQRNRTFSSTDVDKNFGAGSITLQLDNLVVPVMLRYSFGQKIIRPYVEAGGSVVIVAQVDKNEISYPGVGSNGPLIYPLLGLYRTVSVGMGAGAGIELRFTSGRQLALGVRFEQTGGPSASVKGSTLNNAEVLLGYTFTK